MIVELRQKSQITVPSELVKELSLNTGDRFEAVVKDGVLMLVPVAVYPKAYVEGLVKDIAILRKQISSGQKRHFHDVEAMLDSLDKD